MLASNVKNQIAYNQEFIMKIGEGVVMCVLALAACHNPELKQNLSCVFVLIQ